MTDRPPQPVPYQPQPGAPLHPQQAGTLTPQQLNELQATAKLYKKIRKCAGIAMFSGVSTLGIGVLGIGCLGLGVDVTSVLAIVVVIAVGAVEMVARQRLLRGDVGAPKLLALNQLCFIAAITLYCIVQVLTFSPKSTMDEVNKQLAGTGTDIQSLLPGNFDQSARKMYAAFYGLVAITFWLSQGSLAFYYWRRQPVVEAFAATPDWQKSLVQNVST